MRLQLMLAMGVLCAACGSPQPSILASTPKPAQSEQRQFDEPTATLAVSLEKTDWTPATIAPAGAANLTEALKGRASLMVITGSRMSGDSMGDKIFQMIKAASPETAIVARNSGILDEILLERGEIPYRQTLEVGGQDILGRPYLIPKNHPLKTDWLSKKKALKGAEAIMVIDYVTPDDQKLRQMRNQVQGGCAELTTALDGAIADSNGYFDGLLSQVNDALADEFTTQLKSALPFWKEELIEGKAAVDPSGQEARCYNAYQKFLDKYDGCTDGACKLAPSLHVDGGGVIGMEMSGAAVIPSSCPAGMGRNYVSELSALGAEASRQVVDSIPETWAGEFGKVASLELLASEMEGICAPAHRRYREEDLVAAKEAVVKYVEKAVSEQYAGKWQEAEGKIRIGGVGSVTIFARVKQGTSKFNAMRKELKALFAPLNKCRDSKRRPVQVVLVDVGTSEVYFSAIVFEEQLFCEDLPPQ